MKMGILNLLKPPGMTSHDMVSRVRRKMGIKRVGHAGTWIRKLLAYFPFAWVLRLG